MVKLRTTNGWDLEKKLKNLARFDAVFKNSRVFVAGNGHVRIDLNGIIGVKDSFNFEVVPDEPYETPF